MASVLYRDTKVGSAVLFAPAQITSSSQSTVTAVLVTPSPATVIGGGTVDFDWVVLGTNNPSQSATVSTSIGTIDGSGLLTAPAAISSTQIGTVTVTSTQDTNFKGYATFTVPAYVPPTPGFSVKVRYIRLRSPLSSKTNFK